jgi:hypothetical protein
MSDDRMAIEARARRGACRGVLVATLAAALTAPAFATAGSWTPAATLVPACAEASSPQIAFPARSPFRGSGPAAVVFAGDPSLCGGERSGDVAIAPIGANDEPGAPRPLFAGAAARRGFVRPVAAAGTAVGQLVVVGEQAGGGGLIAENRATSRFGPPRPLGGPALPEAVSSGYLGDVAVASVSAHGAILLRVQRFFQRRPSSPVVINRPGGAITALAVNLDFRSDAIVVWAQNGAIWARELHNSGRLEPLERLGPTRPHPQLQALISDDSRSIVAWTTQVAAPSGATGSTRVYLDISAPGVHFGAPRIVDSFRQPAGFGLPDGSLRLVRASAEGAVIAWTGVRGSRYVVRLGWVRLRGPVRPVTARTGADAILADLVTGPRNDALALWTAAPRHASGFDATLTQIVAARFTGTLEAPEAIASAGPNSEPSAAIDPASDRAIAVWRAGAGVDYAIRGPGSASAAARERRAASFAVLAGYGRGALRIAFATLVGVCAVRLSC